MFRRDRALEVKVSNPGPGRAFWVRVVPAPGETSTDWALEPGAAVPFVEAGGSVTLEARIHLLARRTDPQAFRPTLRLAVAQAYGEPIPLEPLTVRALPPVLQVEAAVLLQDGDQSVIALTLHNMGRAIVRWHFA